MIDTNKMFVEKDSSLNLKYELSKRVKVKF